MGILTFMILWHKDTEIYSDIGILKLMIIEIMKSIEPAPKLVDTVASVQAAIDRLKSQCLEWDCSAEREDKPYIEYCQVKAALDDTLRYLTASRVHVSTTF